MERKGGDQWREKEVTSAVQNKFLFHAFGDMLPVLLKSLNIPSLHFSRMWNTVGNQVQKSN